jgi:hypothetical protein
MLLPQTDTAMGQISGHMILTGYIVSKKRLKWKMLIPQIF